MRSARRFAAVLSLVLALPALAGAAQIDVRVQSGEVFFARAPGKTYGPLRITLLDAPNGNALPVMWQQPAGSRGAVVLRGRIDGGDLTCEIAVRSRAGCVELAGTLRGETERSLQVLMDVGVPAAGWTWWDAPRRGRAIDPRLRYATTHAVPVGLRGRMSSYPFACITSDDEALALAVPLREPRVYELAYDGPRRSFCASFDLVVSPIPKRLRHETTFTALLYAPDPRWGLRGAAHAYYALFPGDFERRVERDGVWMPFTRVNDVKDAEDFRFAFHEYGAVDLPWNNAHGVYSFRYLEPWTYWMKMEAGEARNYAVATNLLAARAQGPDAWNRTMARATLGSALAEADGRLTHQFVNEPWCSGTLFHNNSDPDLPRAGPGFTNAAGVALAVARDEILGTPTPRARHWEPFGEGYTLEPPMGPRGRSLLAQATAPGQIHGAVQRVTLEQSEARPLLLRGWSRAEGVTGSEDSDYSLYADVTYTDGTHLWAQTAAFPPGTTTGGEKRVSIRPEKPIRFLDVLVLLRGAHVGRTWFDDVSLREFPDGSPELLKNGNFEEDSSAGRPDGIYLDSMEGWAKRLNFRREHFAHVDVPLTYETGTGRPAILNAFSVYEFTAAMSDLLHRNGRLLMANWVLIDFPWYAALLDVPGKEVHWLDSAGRFAPDSDDTMMYRRLLAAQKPYPLLLNVRFDQFQPAMMEWYFQRCLFYAMAPGMFSHDAASHPYFEDPALYNRDRRLFMRYLPPLQRLSAAGWQAITHAAADAPLLVERYGTHSVSGLFIAVHNDGEAPAEGRLTLDLAALGLSPGATATELLSGQQATPDAGGALDVRMGSYETHVYRICNPGEADAAVWAAEAAGAVSERAAVYGRQQRLTPAEARELQDLAAELQAQLSETGDQEAGAALASLSAWRDKAAALEHPDLRWRIEEAQQACSAWQAARYGLELSWEGASHVVSPSVATGTAAITYRGNDAMELRSLTVASTAGRKRVDAPDSARRMSPGATRTLRVEVPVPAGLRPGDPWPMTLEVELMRADKSGAETPVTLTRPSAGRIVPALDARLGPPRARSFGAPARLTLDVWNNSAVPVNLRARTESAWRATWTNTAINVPARSRLSLPLAVQPPPAHGPTTQAIVVSMDLGGPALLAVTSLVSAHPPGLNLLARDGVAIQVDSCFAGYTADPVCDGVTDTRGLSWWEAAWASADVASPHWVEALLPEPALASACLLHWAEDGGTVQRSQRVRVEVEQDGGWIEIPAIREDLPGGRTTRLRFEPRRVQRIRLWQPAGDGPATRPHLLWLDEWELRAPDGQ